MGELAYLPGRRVASDPASLASAPAVASVPGPAGVSAAVPPGEGPAAAAPESLEAGPTNPHPVLTTNNTTKTVSFYWFPPTGLTAPCWASSFSSFVSAVL